MINSNKIFDRLFEVLKVDSIDQAANKLDINASTLRGRKSRGAIPFEEIVQKLDACQLAYVLKGEVIEGDTYKVDSLEYHYNSLKKNLEQSSVELTKKVEQAPLSPSTKLQIIASVMRIIERDLENLNQNSV